MEIAGETCGSECCIKLGAPGWISEGLGGLCGSVATQISWAVLTDGLDGKRASSRLLLSVFNIHAVCQHGIAGGVARSLADYALVGLLQVMGPIRFH